MLNTLTRKGKTLNKLIRKKIKSKIRKEEIKKRLPHITKEDLVNDFKSIGIKQGDILFVHSSLSKIGFVEGGPHTVIDALLEVLTKEGTLAIPTYTMKGSMFNTCIDKKYLFNLNKPTNLGAIPSELLKMKGIYRSIHPTHSVSAIGKYAEYITKDHHIGEKTFGKNSPWGKVIKLKGKFLGIGISLGPTTQYHYIEDIMENDFPIKVKIDKLYKIKCKISKHKFIYVNVRPLDPNVAKTRIDKKQNHFIRDYFWNIFKSLELLHCGKIGNAKSWWINAEIFSIALIKLAKLGITIYSTEAQLKVKNLYPYDTIKKEFKGLKTSRYY